MIQPQTQPTNPPLPRPLSFSRSDPERQLGIKAGPGTAVNSGFAGIISTVLTTLFFLIVYFIPDSYFRAMLMDRGPTQYATVFLGFWCAVILLIKSRKLAIQRRALRYSVIPENHEFVLSTATVDHVIRAIHAIADDPQRFLVFNRILIALSNLKNLGRVSDVDDILRANAERDESTHQTSFAMLGGFLWAIPVFGFIGTVLGLAASIGKFSKVLEQGDDMSRIVDELKGVTAGLSTAFETTLLALVVAVIIQLWVTTQKKSEETFLDECQDYCIKQIVSRIKILPHEREREVA